MTLSELISATWLRAKGKEFTGSTGDTNYNKIKAIANYYIGVWESEPGTDWLSLYDPNYSIGTVTATDTFALDTDEIRKLTQERNDSVRILHTDDTTWTDYELVAPDTLKQYTEDKAVCARVGNDLVFRSAFTSTSAQFGGDIQVPKYGKAERLSAAGDEVPVDDPNWLVTICAGELARNDVVRQNQYPNFVAEANQLMMKMKENQESQVSYVASNFKPGGSTW